MPEQLIPIGNRWFAALCSGVPLFLKIFLKILPLGSGLKALRHQPHRSRPRPSAVLCLHPPGAGAHRQWNRSGRVVAMDKKGHPCLAVLLRRPPRWLFFLTVQGLLDAPFEKKSASALRPTLTNSYREQLAPLQPFFCEPSTSHAKVAKSPTIPGKTKKGQNHRNGLGTHL
jgi:hypothetical protein